MPPISLRRGRQIGSLEPGKLADFVIHDCGDYRELSVLFRAGTGLGRICRRYLCLQLPAFLLIEIAGSCV